MDLDFEPLYEEPAAILGLGTNEIVDGQQPPSARLHEDQQSKLEAVAEVATTADLVRLKKLHIA